MLKWEVVKIPNWCGGEVNVVGDYRDVEEFCKLFIFDDDTNGDIKDDEKGEYFARSFANCSWEDFKDKYLGNDAASFHIEFAWSACSCLIDGYPSGRCITLEEACKRHKVKVTIDTEESGCAFEEHIECDEEGDLINDCSDMPEWKCDCGNTQCFSESNLNNEECMECGKENQWEKYNGLH